MSKPIDASRPALVATFVAPKGAALAEAAVKRAVQAAGLDAVVIDWLAEHIAADAFFEADDLAGARARLRAALAGEEVDVIVQPVAGRRKKLLVADMDSTMIAQECIDEMADLAGARVHISAITARAMAGDLDFEAALRARVALLKGLTLDAIMQLRGRLTLTPGARALVRTMRARGAHTALVSGGFLQFTDHIAERLGFHETFANRLEFVEGALTGALVDPVQGGQDKRDVLIALRERLGLTREETLAVGDGANDLYILQEAGLGVAYRGKPKVAQAAPARVDHADLTALLYAQGYRRTEFAD